MRYLGIENAGLIEMGRGGEIFIPKEIKTMLNLHEGDPIGFCLNDKREIVIKKLKKHPSFAQQQGCLQQGQGELIR